MTQERTAQSDYMEEDPPCLSCKHLTQVGDNKDFNNWTCKAFPHGIPHVILKGRIEHKTVLDIYPGQVMPYLYEDVGRIN